MSTQEQLLAALQQAEDATAEALKASPQAETGCCTISAAGWSEQKSGITEEACNRQKDAAVTVRWKPGSC